MVVVAGEITSNAKVPYVDIVREVVREIGYTDSAMGFDGNTCAILTAIEQQSPDISQGVTEGEGLHKEQGAGDQGMMFGYACDETPELMPFPIQMAHSLVHYLAKVRKGGEAYFLRPDSKSQVTVEYRDGKPVKVKNVVISTQHSADVEYSKLRETIIDGVIKAVIPADYLDKDTVFHVNPTGRFVVGGPQGDCGLTGRKIIVDTYGGMGRHGGGAFSGKRSFQGRSQRRLHGAVRGQKHRRRGVGQALRSSTRLRDRCGPAGIRSRRHLRHRRDSGGEDRQDRPR
jgi:S-adenosylmethionine synthetase